MEDVLPIAFTITVFALVQSIFGMGLLVFGTPTRLILGLSFSESLGRLFPASVAISAIQALGDTGAVRAVTKTGKPFLCIAPLVCGSIFTHGSTS